MVPEHGPFLLSQLLQRRCVPVAQVLSHDRYCLISMFVSKDSSNYPGIGWNRSTSSSSSSHDSKCPREGELFQRSKAPDSLSQKTTATGVRTHRNAAQRQCQKYHQSDSTGVTQGVYYSCNNASNCNHVVFWSNEQCRAVTFIWRMHTTPASSRECLRIWFLGNTSNE